MKSQTDWGNIVGLLAIAWVATVTVYFDRENALTIGTAAVSAIAGWLAHKGVSALQTQGGANGS